MVQPADTLDVLFGQARAGDAACLNEFCRLIRAGLLQIAMHRLPNWPRAVLEDIVHDTLEIFMQKIGEVQGSPTAFVRGILYNRIGNELQRRYAPGGSGVRDGSQPSEIEYLTAAPSFIHDVENRDTVTRCAKAIQQMDEPCRTFLIGILEGRSVAEVWEHYRRENPLANRAAFDRRLYLCRRRLLELMGVDR